MASKIPPSIMPLLSDYIALINDQLPGFMSAFYLHGSIALGDFHPAHSDIDFITVITRHATESDLSTLNEIHAQLKEQYSQSTLSGAYLQPEDLMQPRSQITPHPAYHDDRLNSATHHETNNVTWWTLKQHGIALYGDTPQNLYFEMDWPQFAQDARENVNTYWRRFITQPARIAWLFGDYGIHWAIPGILRQFYSIREHDITTKSGACDYGLSVLPVRWHRLIHEAKGLRHGESSTYRSRLLRGLEAYRFMRHITELIAM